MKTVCDIQSLGAIGDGIFKNTQIIQLAIDKCAAQGGGIVFFPPGKYLSGTIYLRDNICLELAPGAVLLGSPDRNDYNADDFCTQNKTCTAEFVSGAHLIVALEVTGVIIRGGGRIDGAREAFMNKSWNEFPEVFEIPTWRPAQMLFFCECSRITIENIELFNAPYWTCFLHGCENVSINNLRIWNDQRTHNGDGLDIDCCRRVTVSNCNIDSGDDCITLRADYEKLKKQQKCCEQIVITNCVLRTTRCNAIRIGVGNGTIKDCLFNNIVISESRTGICIISQYLSPAQADIKNILFQNILMNTKRIFVISSDIKGPQGKASKSISNINFDHLRASGCHTALLQGNTDCNIDDINFTNAVFEFYGGQDIPSDKSQFEKVTGETSPVKTTSTALLLRNCKNINFRNTRLVWGRDINGSWEKALEYTNSKNISLDNCCFKDYCRS
jgi:polygalacturonase